MKNLIKMFEMIVTPNNKEEVLGIFENTEYELCEFGLFEDGCVHIIVFRERTAADDPVQEDMVPTDDSAEVHDTFFPVESE